MRPHETGERDDDPNEGASDAQSLTRDQYEALGDAYLEAITTQHDGGTVPLAMRWVKFFNRVRAAYPFLVRAIKNAQEEIARLDDRVAALEREKGEIALDWDVERKERIKLKQGLHKIASIVGGLEDWPGNAASARAAIAVLCNTNQTVESVEAERDLAESYADKLASVILNEPIDWSCHEAKWKEAVERNRDLFGMRQMISRFHELQHSGNYIVQPIGGESVVGWAVEEIRTGQIAVKHGKLILESIDRYLEATAHVAGIEIARKELIGNANNFSGAIAGEIGDTPND